MHIVVRSQRRARTFERGHLSREMLQNDINATDRFDTGMRRAAIYLHMVYYGFSQRNLIPLWLDSWDSRYFWLPWKFPEKFKIDVLMSHKSFRSFFWDMCFSRLEYSGIYTPQCYKSFYSQDYFSPSEVESFEHWYFASRKCAARVLRLVSKLNQGSFLPIVHESWQVFEWSAIAESLLIHHECSWSWGSGLGH